MSICPNVPALPYTYMTCACIETIFFCIENILNLNGLFALFAAAALSVGYMSMCGKHEKINMVYAVRSMPMIFYWIIIIINIILLSSDFSVGPNHAPLTWYTRVYLMFSFFFSFTQYIKHFSYVCLLAFQLLRSVYSIQSPTQNCIIGSMFRLIIIILHSTLTHTRRHSIRIHFTRTSFSSFFPHNNTVLRWKRR